MDLKSVEVVDIWKLSSILDKDAMKPNIVDMADDHLAKEGGKGHLDEHQDYEDVEEAVMEIEEIEKEPKDSVKVKHWCDKEWNAMKEDWKMNIAKENEEESKLKEEK